MFIILVLLLFVTVLILFVNSEIYLRKVFHEIKKIPDNDQELFSFITYLFYGISIIRRGINPIEVYLYPKYIIIEKGNCQRIINNIKINFSKFLGYECMEIKILDLEKPLKFMISNKQKLVMQKYLEIINVYDKEEDIIKHFKIACRSGTA